uniref:5'-nucleotidase domain containing 1 n=1 Tax=Erpetoichthys calabaricus TaxID=27687 RepID=A0A8C4RQG9_ERPCA
MCDVFSLTECDVIGFDLDHTLCRYHLQETCRLLFESLAKYLVEHKGYDKDLLNITTEGWDFCFKGLVLDFEEGNLIKLAEDGTILRATHGTKNLSTNEIVQHYGKERKWKHFNNLNGTFTSNLVFMFYPLAKYYFYDNYFDLPGALLFARVVDLLQKVIIIQHTSITPICFISLRYFFGFIFGLVTTVYHLLIKTIISLQVLQCRSPKYQKGLFVVKLSQMLCINTRRT